RSGFLRGVLDAAAWSDRVPAEKTGNRGVGAERRGRACVDSWGGTRSPVPIWRTVDGGSAATSPGDADPAGRPRGGCRGPSGALWAEGERYLLRFARGE